MCGAGRICSDKGSLQLRESGAATGSWAEWRGIGDLPAVAVGGDGPRGSPPRGCPVGLARGWVDRVYHVVDVSDEPYLPFLLLRPDDHLVWAGDDQRDLLSNLLRWFGVATAQ